MDQTDRKLAGVLLDPCEWPSQHLGDVVEAEHNIRRVKDHVDVRHRHLIASEALRKHFAVAVEQSVEFSWP